MATPEPADDVSTGSLQPSRDGDGLRRWSREAPASVKKAYRQGQDGWRGWQEYLARRKSPGRLEKVLPIDPWAVAWNLPDELSGSPTRLLLDQLAQALATGRGEAAPWPDVRTWLFEAVGRSGLPYAYEVLGWCHALPRLAGAVPEPVWWALVDRVVEAVGEAASLDVTEHPLPHQILAGEAALTLGGTLPELAACRSLVAPARKALSQGIKEVLDGQGMPHADWLPLFRPLAACWTRAILLGRALDVQPFPANVQDQFSWMVRNLIRTSRHDGRQVFTSGSAGAWNAALLRAAMQRGGDADDRKMAAVALPDSVPSAGKSRREDPLLPLAGYESEWASAAILRPEWSRKTPWLAITYPGDSVRTELNCGGDTLWSGLWDWEVCVDGRPVEPIGDWEQLLWVSDSGIDYLEIQIDLEGGTSIQRHAVLAREDRFLMLADAVLGPPGVQRIDYTGRLPLLPDVAFEPAEESTEGHLAGRKRRAGVFPLALPEWRVACRNGQLVQEEGKLVLRQTGQGSRLFAPLWFDLDRTRLDRPFTWRPLTVAEDRRIVASHEAVAYRVQSGEQQWTVYRSLGPRGNRTFLGHNLATSMIVARFSRQGETEALIEVE